MIEIIGIGNILLGDDAVGVYAVREISKYYKDDENIKFIEGETDIYYCTECIQQLSENDVVLIIDACDFDKKCGTVFAEKIETYDKYLGKIVESHEDSLIKIMRREFKYLDGFVINIQIHDTLYRIGLSNELSSIFDDICSSIYKILEKIIKESS